MLGCLPRDEDSRGEMSERIFGLPRTIFLLGLTSLFNDFSSEMIYAIFPAFFTAVLGAGAASLGLVDGIAEAASNIFKIYSGSLSDRLQARKPLVIAGYTLSVLTRPFYVFVFAVPGALGLRFLDRLGKGLRDAARDAMISLSAPQNELGRSFGYHRAMDTIGAILGPLVAYLILSRFPSRFNIVFLTAFGVGAIAILTLFFVKDVVVPFKSKSANSRASLARFSGGFRLYLAAIFVLSMGSLPVAVMLLKTRSIGLAIADIPLFYMVYNLSYAGFSMAAGKLSDRMGARIVILAGYAVLLLSYFLLGSAQSAIPLILGFFILGFFPALTDGVQRAFASQLTSEDLRGSGMGWLNAASGFGALVAGVGGGYLWQAHGPAMAFLAASGIVVVGLVLLLVAAAGGRKGRGESK
jgi:MFS family permease